MREWTSVVTHPLGLVGFALFLVFSVLSWKRRRTPDWVMACFILLAAVVLVGGLTLAYRNQPEAHSGKSEQRMPPAQVHQETHGSQSPAVHGVQGNVTINQEGAAPKK
jgi:hypothetical protein